MDVTVLARPHGLSVAGLEDRARRMLELVDLTRSEATQALDQGRRGERGQFFTPLPTAQFMASLFRHTAQRVRLLDAGAGIGSLTAAWIAAAATSKNPPISVHVDLYEFDPTLAPFLKHTMALCLELANSVGMPLTWAIASEDFVSAATESIGSPLLRSLPEYDAAILNPPYRKINSTSPERIALKGARIETSNLYTAFLWLALGHIRHGGQLVSITPRSFCNGPYFRPFREYLLARARLDHLHVYDARDRAFAEDEVLQETVILKATVTEQRDSDVVVSSSNPGEEDDGQTKVVSFNDVVRRGDPDRILHLPSAQGSYTTGFIRTLSGTLRGLGLSVSTGRVVDFRSRDELRALPGVGTAPLIYPLHFSGSAIAWPQKDAKKANAIFVNETSSSLLVRNGHYVLVRRFSAKEEKRRVSAAVFSPDDVSGDVVGFENHLNYFHEGGGPLDRVTTLGLAAYLNSSLLDEYFRVFSGHTQVNASDLRGIPYPGRDQLQRLGRKFEDGFPQQEQLDAIVEGELLSTSGEPTASNAVKKIKQALDILTRLGLPQEQLNDRSALTLLALAHLRPVDDWSKSQSPMMGVTPIMEFVGKEYAKRYAPNTRETFRKQSLHQFVEAGLLVENPDKPDRATNSPKWCYQLRQEPVSVIRSYGGPQWERALKKYVEATGQLRERYAAERTMKRIPVTLSQGVTVNLSPGGQNELIRLLISTFLPQYAPGGQVIYIGDTAKKDQFFDAPYLEKLGVELEGHGKIPDLIVHHVDKNWLLLIEAVTSHGPVGPKRHDELKRLFDGSKAGLVFVSAFMTRKDFSRWQTDIAWETEVWIADNPSHMIHFNGERFLGPYRYQMAPKKKRGR